MSERRKVVIDTNVLVSGIFWHGKPGEILKLWIKNEIEVFVSKAILEEYLEVIRRLSQDTALTQ